jgi:hypothetical protein
LSGIDPRKRTQITCNSVKKIGVFKKRNNGPKIKRRLEWKLTDPKKFFKNGPNEFPITKERIKELCIEYNLNLFIENIITHHVDFNLTYSRCISINHKGVYCDK